jgi:hypothetical protein
MLTFWGNKQPLCNRANRRQFMQVGGLGMAGLTLADLLRLRAQGAADVRAAHKAVIMLFLSGGPSQLDMYDLKPDAPAEFRGEFKPIRTRVPGFDICELMPFQAQMADQLAVVRSLAYPDPNNHDRSLCFSGFHDPKQRPSFGSVVSRFRAAPGDRLPRYVSMISRNQEQPHLEEPSYIGAAHKPLRYGNEGLRDLKLPRGVTTDQLADRKALMEGLDTLRRDIDTRGDMQALDVFTARAMDMIASPKAMEAFDLSREPDRVRERYGRDLTFNCDNGRKIVWESQNVLLARRLVEAGVSVVTVSLGTWDHHGPVTSCGNIFESLREEVTLLDRTLEALLSDLRERGLDKDVTVVVWGEMGRSPKLNKYPGRDHWSDSGFVLFSGGGLQMGKVVGETDARGARPRTRPYSPQNVLATIYHALGIDLGATVPDFTGRPMYLLDDVEPIAELV